MKKFQLKNGCHFSFLLQGQFFYLELADYFKDAVFFIDLADFTRVAIFL